MSGTARLVGIDLARLVAVAGMMAAHTMAWAEPRPGPGVVALIDGPPSTLFAVLGGVSVALAARSRLAAGDRAGVVRSTLARGLAVLLLGFLVIPLAGAVFVVLVPFGVAIMVGAVLVLLPSLPLALLAAALSASAGSIAVLARASLPTLEGAHSLSSLIAAPIATLCDVLLSGVYPAITWTAYLSIGILLARTILAARAAGRERRALLRVGGLGALLLALGLAATELGLRLLAAAAGRALDDVRATSLTNGYGVAPSAEPVWQLLAAPHTGTPADIARTAGIALIVIALLGLLTASLPPGARRAIEPLRAAGGAPLTIYVVHVVLLTVLGGLLIGVAPGVVGGWGALGLHVAVALGIGALLAASGARGPFERAVGWAAERAGGVRSGG